MSTNGKKPTFFRVQTPGARERHARDREAMLEKLAHASEEIETRIEREKRWRPGFKAWVQQHRERRAQRDAAAQCRRGAEFFATMERYGSFVDRHGRSNMSGLDSASDSDARPRSDVTTTRRGVR